MITIMGTVGRVAIAPDDLPESISTKHLCTITPNQDMVDSTYLWAALLFNEDVRRQAHSAGGGAIMEGWNARIIRSLRMKIPPKPVRVAFERQIKLLRRAQSAHTTSREALDRLFETLSAKAFSGELTPGWRAQRMVVAPC